MPSVLVQCRACFGRYNIQRGRRASSLYMTSLTSQGFSYTATRQAASCGRCPSSFSLATQATLQSITGEHQLRFSDCPPHTRDYSTNSQLAAIWLTERQENRRTYESVLLGVSKASVKRKKPEQGNLINDSTSSRKQEEINILNNGGSETTVTVNTLSGGRPDNIADGNSESSSNNTFPPSQTVDDTVTLRHDGRDVHDAEGLAPGLVERPMAEKNKSETKSKPLINNNDDGGKRQRSPLRGNGQGAGRGLENLNAQSAPRVLPPPMFSPQMRFLNIRSRDGLTEKNLKKLERRIKYREYWGPVRIRSHLCPTMPLTDIAILLVVEDRPPIRQHARNARHEDTRIHEPYLTYYTGTEINLAESPTEIFNTI